MAKTSLRTQSRYSTDALLLLANAIRAGRLGRKMTAQQLADRAGVSRSLVQRIESGDPSCSIGAVFEVAVLAGVPLFESERSRLQTHLADLHEKLTLLPQRARAPKRTIHDDF